MKNRFIITLASGALALQSAFSDTPISALAPKPAPSPADYFGYIDAAAHTANPKLQNGRRLTFLELGTFIGGLTGSTLPDQTGQSGNILSTNGVTPLWIPPPTGSGTGIVDSEQAIAGNATTDWADGIHTLRASSALTANRTNNLPSAASFKKGEIIHYIDFATGATAAFGRSFAPKGSDHVAGGTSPYSVGLGGVTAEFETDGITEWTPIYTRATLTGGQDSTDPTKQFVIDASGVTTMTTAHLKVTADSASVLPSTGTSGQFANGVDANGNLTYGTPAGSGTVTGISAGDSLLFTTTESAAPTPAITFVPIAIGAHTFIGNPTGSSAAASVMSQAQAQTAIALSSTDKPTFANLFQAHSTLTWGATTTINFGGNRYETVTLAGNTTFAQSAVAAGRIRVVRIICDGSTRNLTFPGGWVFVGSAAPSTIAASKIAKLTLEGYGTTDADVVATYSVQP